MPWTYRPDELVALLEETGFDVDRSAAEGIGGGGSLTARRERGGRAVLLVVDAGGRLRLDVTTRRGETAGERELGGIRVRETETTIQTRTLTGHLTDLEELGRVLADLDRVVGSTGRGSAPGPRSGARGEAGDRPW